jgi:hypothetical protein
VRKPSEGAVAIGGLIALSFWLLVALPFLYSVPKSDPQHDQTANKCSAEESKKHGFWEKADCDPVAYFTLWLVGFTGVLAISTIGLWVVTWRSGVRQSRDMVASIDVGRKAAQAAALNARAAVEAERARLFPIIQPGNIYAIIERAPTYKPDDEIATPFVAYAVKNVGRTLATLKEISHQLVAIAELPREREYTPVIPFPIEHILEAGGTSQNITCHADQRMTPAIARDVWAGRSSIWFYGYFSYEDAFERGHEFRFVWQYNHRAGGWELHSFREFHGRQEEA